MAGTALFQDDFSKNGPLDSTKWDFNHWEPENNPSYLGLTQMRQSLPVAQNGMARIQLDTWNGTDGKCFLGSEAITQRAFALPGNGGGIGFQAELKFEGTQGGMIAGFFAYQQFPPKADRNIHDEIDVEILTTNLKKVSTNVFAREPLDKTAHPLSCPVPSGAFSNWGIYTMEWFPDHVSWFFGGEHLRTEKDHVPTQPQQLHMNLWGVPTGWGPSPGDPNGPPVGDPSFTPATSASANRIYFFDVRKVIVTQLPPR
jgi:Glycosyl hydrolases family 16